MGSHVTLVGATGMVGGEALSLLLESPRVARVTAIGRRRTGVTHEKLSEVHHEDFTSCESLHDALEGQDASLFCLGVYTGTVPNAEMHRVTVGTAVAFGRALREASPRAALCFLSGAGADPSGRSRMAFARAKGEAERALSSMGFPHLHVFRPGYIYPVVPRVEPTFVYRLSRLAYPLLRAVTPAHVVTSRDLARAMVNAALGAPAAPVLENRAIQRLAEIAVPT